MFRRPAPRARSVSSPADRRSRYAQRPVTVVYRFHDGDRRAAQPAREGIAEIQDQARNAPSDGTKRGIGSPGAMRHPRIDPAATRPALCHDATGPRTQRWTAVVAGIVLIAEQAARAVAAGGAPTSPGHDERLVARLRTPGVPVIPAMAAEPMRVLSAALETMKLFPAKPLGSRTGRPAEARRSRPEGRDGADRRLSAAVRRYRASGRHPYARPRPARVQPAVAAAGKTSVRTLRHD